MYTLTGFDLATNSFSHQGGWEETIPLDHADKAKIMYFNCNHFFEKNIIWVNKVLV
jgi:hypothetical protein